MSFPSAEISHIHLQQPANGCVSLSQQLLSQAEQARARNQVSLWRALIINSTSHPDNALRKDQTSQDPNWGAPAHLSAQTHTVQGSWQRKCCQLGSSCCPSYLFMPSNFKYSSWPEQCQAGAGCRASRGSPKYSMNGKKL